MNRAELKAMAKAQIKGKIGILFLITLIVGLVPSLLNLIPAVGSIIALLLTPALALSLIRVYLNVIKDVKPSVGDAFSGCDDFWAAFKVQFLVGLYTFLWSLLFYIPGIVKGISYSMSMYVLAENKGMSATECINRSKEMTNGHKMELFVLSLSFLGWAILGAFTFGLLYIWLVPYMQTTFAHAYNVLRGVPEVEAPAEAPDMSAFLNNVSAE